jgi:hypothetical protein
VTARTLACWDGCLKRSATSAGTRRRTAARRAAAPSCAPTVVHVPVFPGRADPARVRVERLAAAAPDAAGARRAVYLTLLELRAERFAEAVEAVAAAPPGDVVVHCAVGKDRTGLVAALLLRLAGVPAAAVAADYAESERHLARSPSRGRPRRRAGASGSGGGA